MDSIIPYGRQCIEEDDIAEVVRVLQSPYLTTGPEVELFEKALCEYTGAAFCVAVSSATAGLHIACEALGLKPGNEGITVPLTFAASANCIRYCGAEVKFCDINPSTWLMDPDALAQAVTEKTKVIIPVHYMGHCCDMRRIAEVASRGNIPVIEDASHAIGGSFEGGKIGACRYSLMSVFSFHPVKNMTTGEGGAVLTNDRSLYKKLLFLRSHGITRDRAELTHVEGPWYYEMQSLGYNYRITDMQCALGRSQLKKIDRFLSRRREIAAEYTKALRGMPHILTPPEEVNFLSGWHLYVIKIDFEKIKASRTELFSFFRKNDIILQVHYIPLHLMPYYGQCEGAFPHSEALYRDAVSLPLYPSLTEKQQRYVLETLMKFLENSPGGHYE